MNKPVARVILAHGMFSNYRACRGLAQYLSKSNFDCWLLDSSGHGYSERSVSGTDFESMCLEDTHAVLDFFADSIADSVSAIAEQSSNDNLPMHLLPLWWVGHSGGGLALAMYLARNPERQGLLSGFVTMASQATDAGYNWHRRLTLRIARMLVKVLKVAPGKLLGLGPENESSAVMDQWLRWSLAGCWSGTDDFNYASSLSAIQLPSLSIAGVGDRFIAPVSGCEKMHHWLGGQDKTLRVFGKGNGHLEDYTHARLVSSRSASVDIWPVIGQWIMDRMPASCQP